MLLVDPLWAGSKPAAEALGSLLARVLSVPWIARLPDDPEFLNGG